MTIAQTMLEWMRAARGGRVGLWAAGAALAGALGCAGDREPRLVAPANLVAPYDTTRGEVLWAVAPLRNETGTTIAEPYGLSDKVVAAAAQVAGVRTLPLNRTIAAMRALGLTHLASPDDVRALAAELGVDGLIVGSITAFDPYNPPTLGLALALYARPGALETLGTTAVDPRALARRPTDGGAHPGSSFAGAPLSTGVVHLDGKNHQVQMDVRRYAEGRHDPRSALAWRRYLASMDLFSEFAAWEAVDRLLEREWVRLAGAAPREGGN